MSFFIISIIKHIRKNSCDRGGLRETEKKNVVYVEPLFFKKDGPEALPESAVRIELRWFQNCKVISRKYVSLEIPLTRIKYTNRINKIKTVMDTKLY